MAINQPVGVMQIVLTSNNASFSAGIAEAQRKLDAFAKTASGAGHSTVSSMQSASAAIRLLENPLGNNIRAIERLVSQSKVLSEALKVAFPFVGAIAGGMIVAKLGEDVAKFIKTVQEMPKAIKLGFGALNLEQKTATDELILKTDELRNAIAKLQGKPQDNLKIALDEERLAADRLAASIVNANSKLNELLSKNHLTGFAALLGRAGTADRQGTAKYFADQADSNAFDLANATTPEQIAKAKKAIADTQNAQLAEARNDLANRLSIKGQPGALDDSNNINIDKGIITTILASQKQQNAEIADASAEADHKKQEAANAAIEQAKRASAQRLEAMKDGLAQEKLEQAVSLKQEYDYWALKISTFSSKSKEYGEIVRMQATLAAEGVRKASEEIKKFQASQLKGTGGEGSDAVERGLRAIQEERAKAFGLQNQDFIDSNELSIVNAHNEAREREAQITDEAGRSMSRYAAAVQMAQVHAEEYFKVMQALQAILGIKQGAFTADPTKENARAVEQARAALAGAQSQGATRLRGDLENINGRSTSGSAGAADALKGIETTAKDTYSQMQNLITTTQSAINDQILRGLSGQRTDFRNAGAGIFRSVAGTALQKGEGSIIGLFDKKLGTRGNPMFVQMATIDTYNSANASAKAVIDSMGSSSDNSILKSLAGAALGGIPMLAGGGALGADQWAVVGEKGPELFHSGGGGTVVPNNKISQGGDTHHYNHFDARGAVDPEQTKFAMRQAIQEAAPHLIAGSVRAVGERRLRRPSTSR